MDDCNSEDIAVMSPLSFSNFLYSGNLSPDVASISNTWNDNDFIFPLDDNYNEESIVVPDVSTYPTESLLGHERISSQFYDTNDAANRVLNTLDINNAQSCAADDPYNKILLNTYYQTGHASNELYTNGHCDSTYTSDMFDDPGHISNAYYNPSNAPNDFCNLGKVLNTPNYPQDEFYGMPMYRADELENSLAEIRELKELIKQYIEEMRSMHEYMREVPAMHKELQMTKERCERIGQGLHKFSIDLLKYKDV